MNDLKIEGEPIANTQKDNIVPRLPTDLYSAFIKTSKFHHDLIIPPSQIDLIPVSNKEAGYTSNSETYEFAALTNVLYSNQVIKESDITMNITKIVTSEDWRARASSICEPNWGFRGPEDVVCYVNLPGAVHDQIFPYTDFSDHNYPWLNTGNPNPYQAPTFGFVCDILNASLSQTKVVLSTNGEGVINQFFSPKYLDVTRRKLDKDALSDFDGLRYPDKSINTGQYVIPFKKRLPLTLNNGLYMKMPPKSFIEFESPHPTYLDLENDDTNMLSQSFRGGVFKNKKVTYIFTKSIESPNYTIDLVTGVITTDNKPTKELTTLIIGNYQFPSNVTNANAALSIAGPYLLFYYTNKLSLIATRTGGDPNGATAVPPVEVAPWIYTYTPEPALQTLNIQIVLSGVRSPVYNSLLSDVPSSTWSNTTTFRAELQYKNNNTPLVRNIHLGQELAKDPRDAQAGFSMVFSNQKLYLQQYILGSLCVQQQPVTTVPYLNIKIQPVQQILTFTAQVQAGSVTTAPLAIGGDIPKSVTLYIDRPGTVITSVEARINSGANQINRTWDALFDLTKKNGNHFYSREDSFGYANKYHKSLDSTYTNLGSGTIIELCLGSNIPLGSQALVAGLSTREINITYTVNYTAKLLGDVLNTPITIPLLVQHNTESMLLIADSFATNVNNLFTSDDVSDAIKAFQEKATGGELYVNSRRFYHGGKMMELFKHHNILPKIFTRGQKLIQSVLPSIGVYNNAKKPQFASFFK